MSKYQSTTGAIGFISGTEKDALSLKNGMVQNILSGDGLAREDAVLTNERLYYCIKSGVLDVHYQEDIIDLEDITACKITDLKPYGLLVGAVLLMLASYFWSNSSLNENPGQGIFLAGLVLGVCMIAGFFILKKSFLEIQYAGGRIRFSVKKYKMKDVREFQRRIYLNKDRLEDQLH